MRSAALTDRGLVREENEDAFVVTETLAAVADGMGGHQAGEVASRTAVKELADALVGPLRRPTTALLNAFSRANTAVLRQAAQADKAGMGSTLTALVLRDRRAWIGHIGDSRAYLLREGRLTQLTRDHSLVADLVRNGSLSPEEARVHPRRHVITKAIGSEEVIEPDIFSVGLLAGDRLILCTDGLTNHVESDRIAELAGENNLQTICRDLVEAAKAGGGSDNITVVVVEIDAGAPAGRKEKSTRLKSIISFAVIIAALAVAGAGASSWLNSHFYLVSSDRRVAVGRGLPAEFAGYRLGRLERTTSIRVDRLPAYYRTRLSKGLVVGDAKRLSKLLRDLKQLSETSR